MMTPAEEDYAWRRFVERAIDVLCTAVQQPTAFDVEATAMV